MDERFSILNMPTMSSSTYFAIQKDIHDKIREVALVEMENAIETERKIAISKGNVDANGIPLLTVVVDGSWAKRSYKSTFSSLSVIVRITIFLQRQT